MNTENEVLIKPDTEYKSDIKSAYDIANEKLNTRKPIYDFKAEDLINKNINTVKISGAAGGQPMLDFEKLSPKMQTYIMEESLSAQRDDQRRQFIQERSTEITDEDMTLFKHPRKSCKCNGLGRTGWDSTTGNVILCSCLNRGKLLESTPKEFMTYAELKEIFDVKKPLYPRDHIRPKSQRRVESKAKKLARKRRKHG